MEFRILKKSAGSSARLGIIHTAHGDIQTPAFVPVATQAAVKTLHSEEVVQTGAQLLIANTFHLHLKPGERIIRSSGGLHVFMNWERPLMTDSGGFQVFSLGFGKDLNVGKIAKKTDQHSKQSNIYVGAQPISLKIVDRGVYFRSPVDGKKLFLGPKESIRIQEQLGADIIFAFDECTPPFATRAYIEQSLERTHQWEKISREVKKSSQALFGIVQGSTFKDLRERSAKFINALEFDGFGIGGDLGENGTFTRRILQWSFRYLDPLKPRHLLGIGHLKNMVPIIQQGVDLFDCTQPTHYARHGIVFTRTGTIDMRRSALLKDKNPLDKRCGCFVCQGYKRNYIAHLFKANEISGLQLVTFHNLYFFHEYVKNIRKKIQQGRL